MSSYSGTANRPDRAKAIAAVVLIHVALAALIFAGLDVGRVRSAVEQLKTVDFREVPPPPANSPPRPAPRSRASAAAPAPRAQAARVVAPPRNLPLPSPVPAARVAAAGNQSASGAATAGTGGGAGGTGSGTGGRGVGQSDGDGFTPARLVSNIPSAEYRQLASTGIPSGLVGVTIRVQPDGSVGNCRVARSSGDGGIDGLVCALTERYVRFLPARDPSGRAIGQDVTYFPNWRRRHAF